MVAALQIFLLVLSVFFLLSIGIGLYKPVLVLWFLDRFNRQKVLSMYGKCLGMTILLLLIVKLFEAYSV